MELILMAAVLLAAIAYSYTASAKKLAKLEDYNYNQLKTCDYLLKWVNSHWVVCKVTESQMPKRPKKGWDGQEVKKPLPYKPFKDKIMLEDVLLGVIEPLPDELQKRWNERKDIESFEREVASYYHGRAG